MFSNTQVTAVPKCFPFSCFSVVGGREKGWSSLVLVWLIHQFPLPPDCVWWLTQEWLLPERPRVKPELHPRPAIEWFHLAYIWTHSWDEGRHVFLNEDGTWEKTCFSHLCNFLPGSRRFLSSYSLETKRFMYIKPGQNQVLPLKGTGATSCLHHPLCWRKNRDGCFICTFLACACQRYTSLHSQSKCKMTTKQKSALECPSRLPDFCKGAKCPSSGI